ncbi:hypothetical protein QUB63_10145 [Microcoleus sp. ARI1-B5]
MNQPCFHVIAAAALGFIALPELTTPIDTDVMKVCLGGEHFYEYA